MARDLVVGVDVGGTFTDLVAARPGMPPTISKLPTTPADQSRALAAGLAATGGDAVAAVAHGTTTATNALLERTFARTALLVTAGFEDVLVLARQDRPSLYDLRVTRPDPPVPTELTVGVRERVGPDGTVLTPLTDEEAGRAVAAVAAHAPEAVAICLLFSWARPDHEERLAEAVAARLPDVHLTVSSRLLPELREHERASTCAVNAVVGPVMARYLSRVDGRVGGRPVTVMTSGGGTASLDAAAAEPSRTLLSGPAAGAVAAARVARDAGHPDAVAFDMGGTSTDVCLLLDGQPQLTAVTEVAGHVVATPAVAIHTVGAGGGSVAWVDAGGALRVGPRSAGAEPGPACYGRGGTEPTVTDAHAVLGHLTDLAAGSVPLDLAAARAAFEALPVEDGPAGVLTVVRAAMVRALRRVTTEQGVDPGGLALVAFGGAGPLHAAAVAHELGCPVAIVPPSPGVLSALGLLLSPTRREASRTVMAHPDDDLEGHWAALADEVTTDLAAQAPGQPVTLTREADLRYAGQAYELRVPAGPGTDLPAALAAAHRRAYGYDLPSEPVEVVTLRVVGTTPATLDELPDGWAHLAGDGGSPTTRRADLGSGMQDVAVHPRAALRPGDAVPGPAIVTQDDATTLVPEGTTARVDDRLNLLLRREVR